VLIPKSEIRTKLVVMAHMFASGHRGAQTTFEQLEAVVFWPGMKTDVKEFVDSCIHCQANIDHTIARPFGKPIMASERNQVLSMDYLHLGLNQEGFNKILILSDRLSGFSLFYTAVSESAENAVTAVLDWIAMFGVPQILVSDQGTGFDNEVMKMITEKIGSAHHMTTARVHYSHGKQERLNHIVATMFRKLLSENQMDSSRWNDLLPVIQMSYNHTPTHSLANYAPITVFTGLAVSRPIHGFLEAGKLWKNLKIDIADFVEQLRNELLDRTITVSEIQEQAFYRQEVRRKRKQHVKQTNFMVGDFVMVYEDKKTKLSQRWIGPAQIVSLDSDGNRVFVRFLAETASKLPKEYHSSHVQFFDYAVMQVSQDVQQQAEFYASHRYNVAGLVDIRKVGKDIQIQVEWDSGDLTWEPLVTIYTDVNEMAINFLSRMAKEYPQLVSEAQDVVRSLIRKRARHVTFKDI